MRALGTGSGPLLSGLILLALGTAHGLAHAGSKGNVNFTGGTKWLEESDWSPVEEQPMGALDVMWGDERWPILIHAYYSGSTTEEPDDPGTDIDGSTWEAGLGVTKVWDVSHFHPYVGGGLAAITGKIEIFDQTTFTSFEDTGYSGGVWLAGGGFFRVLDRINLGLGARLTAAEGEILGEDVDLGGWSFGLLLGWAWPASK